MVTALDPHTFSTYTIDDTSTATINAANEYGFVDIKFPALPKASDTHFYKYGIKIQYTWKDLSPELSLWERIWLRCPKFGKTAPRALTDGEVRPENSVTETRKPRKPLNHSLYFKISNPCGEVSLGQFEKCALPGLPEWYVHHGVKFGIMRRRL